jgi:hypothetical protein
MERAEFAKAMEASEEARDRLAELSKALVRRTGALPTKVHLSAEDAKLFAACREGPLDKLFGYEVMSTDAEETYVE